MLPVTYDSSICTGGIIMRLKCSLLDCEVVYGDFVYIAQKGLPPVCVEWSDLDRSDKMELSHIHKMTTNCISGRLMRLFKKLTQ